jgi:hypothetical protein
MMMLHISERRGLPIQAHVALSAFVRGLVRLVELTQINVPQNA